MCDFVSYLLYDHPEEGWKLISRDLTSHSRSVSALKEQFGLDYNRYAQVESQHESNYSEDFQIQLASGLTRKNVTREFVQDKILELAPTLPDLVENLILGGLTPHESDIDSAIEHEAWKTLDLLAEHVERIDRDYLVTALISSYTFNEEVFAKFAKGVELDDYHLEAATEASSPEAVRAVLKRTKGKVTKDHLSWAAEYGDAEIFDILMEFMRPTEEILMNLIRYEHDTAIPVAVAKMKRIDLDEGDIMGISEIWMETEDRIAIAMKLRNAGQKGYALFNFIYDEHEKEVLALIKAGVKMKDELIIEIISESESSWSVALLKKYLLKNRPSKRVLVALDENIEGFDTWDENLLDELKKLRASMKRKWK